MKRRIPSFEEANMILDPYYDKIKECIEGAIDDYAKIKDFTNSLGHFSEFENRTKASIIHDQIKSRVISSFGDDSYCEAQKYNGIFGLKIGDDFIIRFKKLDNQKGISGIKTAQFIKYMGQSMIIGFPDTPSFLFAGYIPEKSWTAAKGIFIACWNGSNIQWYQEIGKYSVEQLNIFEEIIIDPEETKTSRVKLKDSILLEKNLKTGTDNF